MALQKPILAILLVLLALPAAGAPPRWSWLNPTPQSHTIYSLVWTGKQLVAGSEMGAILTSPDGEAWETVDLQPGMFYNSMAWNGKLLVAVGPWDRILTSSDLKTFTTTEIFNTIGPLRTVIWTGSRFIAAGEKATILTSEDGTRWDKCKTPVIFDDINEVASNGATSVAVTSQGRFLHSPDGLVWDTIPAPFRGFINSVAWAGNRFVAVGDSVFTSPDGITWTVSTGVADASLVAVAWTGTSYVAVGTSVWVSPDASSWTKVDSMKMPSQINMVVWTGSRLVAVGRKGEMFLSDSGREWRQVRKGSTNNLTCIARSPAKYVAMGWRDTVLTSVDGVNWTPSSLGNPAPPGTFHEIIWTGERFYAVGNQGAMYSSADGVEWRKHDIGTALNLYSILHWNGRFLVLDGGGGILHSTDGEKWTRTRLGAEDMDMGGKIIRGGDKFLVCGSYGRIYTSEDGLQWTLRYNSTLQNKAMSSMAWNGQVYVAVGGAVMRSQDGIHWDGQYGTGYKDGLSSIIWSGREFIAVGGSGTILHSSDGVEWKAWPSGAGESLGEVIQSGNRLIAVGGYGTILSMPYESPSAVEWHRLRPGPAKSASRVFSGSGFLFHRLFKDDRGAGYSPNGRVVPWREPEKDASP